MSQISTWRTGYLLACKVTVGGGYESSILQRLSHWLTGTEPGPEAAGLASTSIRRANDDTLRRGYTVINYNTFKGKLRSPYSMLRLLCILVVRGTTENSERMALVSPSHWHRCYTNPGISFRFHRLRPPRGPAWRTVSDRPNNTK